MKIKELFRGDIERSIEEVIHVDLSDDQIVAHEIDEYVVTDNIRAHLEELTVLYAETARNPSESTNVWVSGVLRFRQEQLRQDGRLRAGQPGCMRSPCQ